ncbi:MAG TPA: response regulator [Verrucomicrobiae bacterium]|jgi:CheY-like chemotaxis protein
MKWENEQTPRILIVDDNRRIHEDFNLVFSNRQRNLELEADQKDIYGQFEPPAVSKPAYELDHAFSGNEGIEKTQSSIAEGRPYQVAFVDIRMPGMDGVEALGRIWAIDSRIQAVICTAFADYSWEDLARRLGQSDKLLVLKKPFDHIEVFQMACTLSEKWFLARQVALKFEQMELLVAQRTQRLLDLQRREAQPPHKIEEVETPVTPASSVPATAIEDESSMKEQPSILLVQNDADLAVSIQQGFGPDYRTMLVKDGAQGLIQARETLPDIIIAEVTLSILNGIELCRKLKNDELTSHIPVILLATQDSESGQLQALEAGADDYLIKPFKLSLLKARVDNLQESRQKLHELFKQVKQLYPRDIATNQSDAKFIRRVIDLVEANMADWDFDLDIMARKLAVSRRQLFRKIRAAAGCSPNTLIRTLRLRRAAQLLTESQMTVTEITYAVGFSDLKYFRAIFRDYYGVAPGEYLKHSKTQ